MRILFSSFSFLATMVVGAIAFAFTAIEFPTIMRDLIAYAQGLPGYLSSLGVGDRYMVWMDILLTGDKLVLLGFILATRILFSIITGIVGGDQPPARASFAPEKDGSPFKGWAKPS
jgi:hypothetical protein